MNGIQTTLIILLLRRRVVNDADLSKLALRIYVCTNDVFAQVVVRSLPKVSYFPLWTISERWTRHRRDSPPTYRFDIYLANSVASQQPRSRAARNPKWRLRDWNVRKQIYLMSGKLGSISGLLLTSVRHICVVRKRINGDTERFEEKLLKSREVTEWRWTRCGARKRDVKFNGIMKLWNVGRYFPSRLSPKEKRSFRARTSLACHS